MATGTHHQYHSVVRRRLWIAMILVVVATTTSVVFTSTHSFEYSSSLLLLASRRRHSSRCPYASCVYKKPSVSFGIDDDAARNLALVSKHGGRNPLYSRTFVSLAAVAENQEDEVDGNEEKTKLLGRKQGVYTRPSAAIERGSGFFVPGLEGAKVRLAVGTVLLFLAAVNHFLSVSSTTTSTSAMAGNALAEGLAVFYSLLVLVQAAIEYTKDDLSATRNAGQAAGGGSDVKKKKRAAEKASSSYQQQQWSSNIPMDEEYNDDDWKDQVEWSTQTYLSLTPATSIMLIGGSPGRVIYRFGTPNNEISNDEEEDSEQACKLALQLLSKSSSGRLSLPASHPIATALVPKNGADDGEATSTRNVILQRISTERNLAFLVSSNQLLASFTPQDLTWLGQLARACGQ
jgi:hypothetical protein